VALKVHITGGKGFLGAYSAEAMSDYEVEISDVDTLDVTDQAAVIERMRESKPDVVCHLAGLTGANPSLREPRKFFEVGCTGTINVLEACRQAEVGGFVFLSSLTVHGQTVGGAVDEQSLMAPRHPYAGAKAAAELVVQTYARCYEMKAAILRPTLIAGEGQKEPNAVSDFTETVERGEAIEIYGDGSHKREWLHPSDVGRAVRAAVDHVVAEGSEDCETFIVSSGAPVSMAEIAEMVIAKLGKGEVVFQPSTRQVFDLCTSPAKANNELKWTPTVSIEEIVQRVIDMA